MHKASLSFFHLIPQPFPLRNPFTACLVSAPASWRTPLGLHLPSLPSPQGRASAKARTAIRGTQPSLPPLLSVCPPPTIPALGITQVSLINPAASPTQTSQFSCTLGSAIPASPPSLSRLPNETWDSSCYCSRWYPRNRLLHSQLCWGRSWSLLEPRRQAEPLAPGRRPLSLRVLGVR